MLQNDLAGTLRPGIRNFVLQQLETRGVADIANDASLVDAGVIDSLGIFQLISFLESTFRIQISDNEIVLTNFETIDATVDFVARKLPRA
jgi:acyl carrier protein